MPIEASFRHSVPCSFTYYWGQGQGQGQGQSPGGGERPEQQLQRPLSDVVLDDLVPSQRKMQRLLAAHHERLSRLEAAFDQQQQRLAS